MYTTKFVCKGQNFHGLAFNNVCGDDFADQQFRYPHQLMGNLKVAFCSYPILVPL